MIISTAGSSQFAMNEKALLEDNSSSSGQYSGTKAVETEVV